MTVTLNVATFGSGTNPSASTFALYPDVDAAAAGKTPVTSKQGGTLPKSSTYTDVTYTVEQANASSLTTDLIIKITKPGRQIRLKSIKVAFSYVDKEVKTVSSLALSGNPTKTEYYTNEAFSTAGLTATAYYTDGTNADVTSQSTFECDPATFTTAGTQNVSVTAIYNETRSNTATYSVTVTELPVYTLVTDVSQLAAGDKIVLANQSAGMVLSTTQNKNNRKATSEGVVFAEENNSLTFSSDQVEIITLEAGKTDGTFAFKVTGGYLYASGSSSNNYLKTKAEKDANGSAKISIDSSTGVASIVFQGTNTNNVLRYNSTSELFACYGSATQSPVYIYKAASSGKPAVPTFDPASGTAFDTETATVTITAPEGCTLKYTVGSGEEQTSTTNTAQVTVSPTAYTITAKSVDAKGVESNEATATYTFNVVAHVKNIAEFLALPDKTTAIFDNPVVVLYDYSQPSLKKTDGQYLSNPEYIWVKDESGQTNLYLEEAINPTNHQAKYENGDVIPAGFKAVKNYFSDGNFYQALVDIDNKSLLADASHKRLADPVTITFDEFNALQVGSDAHIAKWNNTYVMIPKVTMAADASDKWGKTYFVYQDGVKATSNVFYNKYSDLRDEEYALTKQGEDARVTMPTSSTKEYNVYGILQVYNNIWEIMPIRFVEYSAQTLTLKELVELGKANSTTSTTEYTILNDLRGVRALTGNVILAKDENGNAVDKVTPAGNSFMINAKSKFDDAATVESVNAKAQEDYDQSNWVEIVLPSSVSAADYVDHIITGMTVKGNYTDTTNPRLEASAAPTAGGPTGAYTRNAMCPANFMGTSQACNAEQNHGDFFFMTPKPNECVQVVWAVYNSTAKAFYIPAAQGSINSHGFKGAFSIDWAYNAGGEITNLTDGNLYQFAAVVKKIEPGPRSPKRKVAYDNGQPLSSDYVVFPLNLDANTVTGITETTGAKTVKSVRYFNIMGVELAEPTAGVNIVLTTYTDGTTHSQKILK
ncbi:MAG: bacterial Ig-like domain-containing protein [Sodaliphilus sp.]